jgi:6-bladed beta-propeller
MGPMSAFGVIAAWAIAATAILYTAPYVTAQQKGGEDATGAYDVVANWPQPIHPDWTWGRTGGVWAESADRVYVLQQGELPALKRPGPLPPGSTRAGYAADAANGVEGGGIPARNAVAAEKDTRWEHRLLVFDRNGKLIESWQQHDKLFIWPHSVKINPYDPERHVWILDGRSESGKCAEQLFKFTRDGKLVMTVGEYGVPGNDKTHFGGPTDIAFLPNGDFLVADGYKNGRVVKFNKDGKYLSEFGKRGSAPGEFTQVHSIAVDARGRIYAADRGNSRIQVFDGNGKLLDVWPNIDRPNHILITKDQSLWVADSHNHRLLKYDLKGKLQYWWGAFGGEPGRFWGVHQFSVDNEGNVYTAEVYGGRAQKFRPRKDANPSKLIGPLFVLPSLVSSGPIVSATFAFWLARYAMPA